MLEGLVDLFDVAIGLVLLYLVLSYVCSALTESYSAWKDRLMSYSRSPSEVVRRTTSFFSAAAWMRSTSRSRRRPRNSLFL